MPIIQPKIKGPICTTAHPQGCRANVAEQIQFVRSQPPIAHGPARVLVIGASTGYGLASRIAAAFGGGARTIGVFFEKPASEKRTATAGWYNSAAFQSAADAAGLYSKNINGDAFSQEVKDQAIELIAADLGQVDLVVYSLAAPRRQHPDTGAIHASTLKPIGRAVTQTGLDTDRQIVRQFTLPPATQQEIDSTVAVMGGDDWERSRRGANPPPTRMWARESRVSCIGTGRSVRRRRIWIARSRRFDAKVSTRPLRC
jgi:enoyl-[acyl-carrier protein] reductase / trans-2-enoyl-CoA reductase (NAD+)